MLINYHAGAQGFAFATTPGDLNAWLNGQTDGWNSPCGGPNRWAVARYARQNGISLYYQGDKPGRNDFIVDNYLCANAPIILWVNNEGHYVLATGQTFASGADTFLINDPGHRSAAYSDLSAYNFTYTGVFAFSSTPNLTFATRHRF